MTIFERVSAWNAARYEQEYVGKLQVSLLREELTELVTTDLQVEQLDALCDTMFVAFGGFWKLKHDPRVDGQDFVEEAISLLQSDSSIEAMLHRLDLYEERVDKGIANATDHLIINYLAISFCRMAMHAMFDLGPEQSIKALEIVCDSNDTKAVKKTDSDVKANIDKGEGFVAPEPRLQELLDNA